MAIAIGAAFMALAATAFLTFPQTIIHPLKSSRPRTSFWATFSRPYGT
jgi:hypothetical protein